MPICNRENRYSDKDRGQIDTTGISASKGRIAFTWQNLTNKEHGEEEPLTLLHAGDTPKPLQVHQEIKIEV